MVEFTNEAGTTVATLAATQEGPYVRDAYVVLDHNRYSWIWVVTACPYCGKAHDHYAGPLDGNPKRYLGNRYAAHCNQSDRQRMALRYGSGQVWYTLVATRPLPAARTLLEDQLAI